MCQPLWAATSAATDSCQNNKAVIVQVQHSSVSSVTVGYALDTAIFIHDLRTILIADHHWDKYISMLKSSNDALVLFIIPYSIDGLLYNFQILLLDQISCDSSIYLIWKLLAKEDRKWWTGHNQ